jgi:GT2 family glycosyltransferase
MGEPGITVVVTTVSDSETLRTCLDTLAEQARRLDAELLLAVNTAEEEMAEAVRRELSDRVDRILFEPEPGKSHAFNAAVRTARGRILAATDDDARPDPNWLAAITEPLDEDHRYGCCGGPVLPEFPPGGPPAWYRRLLAGKSSHFIGPLHFHGHERTEYGRGAIRSALPFGASWAFRRELLVEYPAAPELGANLSTGFRGGFDHELVRRIIDAGHRALYVPEARVYHPVVPERLTLSFVRERHYAEGRAAAVVRRLKGEPPADPEELRRRIRRKKVGWLGRMLLGPRRALARELRCAMYEGELFETVNG